MGRRDDTGQPNWGFTIGMFGHVSRLVVESETDLQFDLELGDFPVLDAAAHFGDLEPIEVVQRLGCFLYSKIRGVCKRLSRSTDDSDQFVHFVRH